MADLSPAAQACVTAFQKVDFESGHFTCEDMWIISRKVAAAALRAAAYQVVPARPVLDSCCEHFEQAIRHKLLAIAAELEGAQ